MLKDTVSDFTIDRLIDWGLHRFYGYPGDGVGGLDGALERGERAGKNFTYIRPTHEEIAALMACAHAKFTGKPGVCIATSGPGAIHLLNGLYDAKMDNQPVVAVVGQQGLVSLGSDAQQQLNLERLFADVAGYVQTVATPAHTQLVVDRAVRISAARRCPTVIILPADVQNMDLQAPGMDEGVSRTGVGYASTVLTPPETELRRAADVLNSGKRVAMLVGQGARGATDEVVAVAERLGAGVATALLGKDVVPGDVPYHTQQLGLLGSKPSFDLMSDCDTLLMVGSNFPYSDFLPATGDARGVQIDLSPDNLSLRYPMEVELLGDTSSTLGALLPFLDERSDFEWQHQVIEGMEKWEESLKQVAMVDAEPINPRYVFYELNNHLPDDCIITADAGSTADWYGLHIRLGRAMLGSLSGLLASMIAAMPYATAAKFAHQDRPVVCTIGDGAFQMLGMNELLTVKRHWRQWKDPRFVVLVLHNDDLTQVSWEMRQAGDPRYDTSQLVEDFDYAGYAELLGLKGIRVDEPSQVARALVAAFSADRPVVLDIHTDPNVPPLPPHISVEDVKGLASSLLKGDPANKAVIGQSARAAAARLFADLKSTFTRDD